MSRFRILAILGAFAMAGCSSDDGGGGNAACTVTFSGGLTGSYSCTAMLAAYTNVSNLNTTSYSVSLTTPALNSTINFLGEAVQGSTYARGATGASGGIVLQSGTSSWSVTAGTGGTGSYSLALTSVATLSSTAQGKAYTVHGTLDATIPAVGGSVITTAVTMHVVF